ncbi:MAG: HEAT repeat domain-containing protein [Planctomycetaceae bacterium]
MTARSFLNLGSRWATGWLAGILLCAGCQIISAPEQVVTTEHPVVDAPAPDSPELTELTKLLTEGHWERDRSWSVLSSAWEEPGKDGESAVRIGHRWRFVVPEQLKPPPRSRDGLPAPIIPPDPERQALIAKYQWLWDSSSVGVGVSENHQSSATAALVQLSSRCDPTGANAALLLARQSSVESDPSGLLEGIVRASGEWSNPALRKPGTDQRCAAAEIWCELLSARDEDPETALAPVGRALEEATLPEDVRGELYRGVAWRIPPRLIPGLNAVMQRDSPTKGESPTLKLAALEACVIHAWRQHRLNRESAYQSEDWPDGLRNCRFSDDAGQRKLFGRWSVLVHQADALAVLKSQRLDRELSVREAAVVSLGLLDSPAARDELHAAMSKGTELEKVAAIGGFARSGPEELAKYAHDESPRVRSAIAAHLGKLPARASGLMLADYLSDRSPEVQLAALTACEQPAWSSQERIPLLLQALKSGVLKTRLAALAGLQQEWGAEPIFPVDGTLEERQAAVRQLTVEHQVSAEVFTAFAAASETSSPTVSRESLRARIHQLVDAYLDARPETEEAESARERLLSLDPTSAAVLEQELALLPAHESTRIAQEILPRVHPTFGGLASLASQEAGVRRTGARQLKEWASQASLSPMVLRKMQSSLLGEQDQLVWSEVIAAISPDATPEAAQIALVALNSQWPDIRQMGCEYFSRHPQPEYALWLLPRLQDADRSVKLRAIQILAQCGNPVALDGFADSRETTGLRPFLSSADQQLRWEAVVAMSTLGDARAAQELVRQTYDPQPRQREKALQAMGKTGQSRFVEPLVKQLWTETDPSVQGAILDALHQLTPIEEQAGLAVESSISDKINHWTRWWEARQKSHRGETVRPVAAGGRSY